MKKQLFILAIAAISIPALAQTNETHRARGGRDGYERDGKRDNKGSEERKRGEGRRREMSPEMQEKRDERRLQLMEKTLKDIGVTEEQKTQIIELQSRLSEEQKEKDHLVSEARKKLTKLQNEGATREVLFVAIDELTAAQGEKMKALVVSQLEMERILGAERYQAFMDSARDQWRESGRRGGGLPPKPELPPLPTEESETKEPPLPPSS